MDSYKIKAICKSCGMIISLRADRIKSHLLKCGKGNDLGQYEEIASIVRFKDKNEATDEFKKKPKNVMPYKNSFDGDSGHTPSYKKYGVTPDEWAKVYGDHALREINDARYPHKLTPHKRLRSDSENSVESTEIPLLKKPRYWSEEIQNRTIKATG